MSCYSVLHSSISLPTFPICIDVLLTIKNSPYNSVVVTLCTFCTRNHIFNHFITAIHMALKHHNLFILRFIFYRTVRTTCVYFLYRTHFFVKNYATHIKYRVGNLRVSKTKRTHCVERIELIPGFLFSDMLHEAQMQPTKADDADEAKKQPSWIESLKAVVV